MKTVFVQLHKIDGTPVLVNPNFVPAIEGSVIHLFGGGFTVTEQHDEIVRLFAEALGFEEVPARTTKPDGALDDADIGRQVEEMAAKIKPPGTR